MTLCLSLENWVGNIIVLLQLVIVLLKMVMLHVLVFVSVLVSVLVVLRHVLEFLTFKTLTDILAKGFDDSNVLDPHFLRLVALTTRRVGALNGTLLGGGGGAQSRVQRGRARSVLDLLCIARSLGTVVHVHGVFRSSVTLGRWSLALETTATVSTSLEAIKGGAEARRRSGGGRWVARRHV